MCKFDSTGPPCAPARGSLSFRMPHKMPGRPLAFVPAETVESVLALFWRQGYAGTSLDDLERATGLARSSLYNTFGSKRDLYLESLRRYFARLVETMFEPLEKGDEGLADVEAFFERLAAGLACQLGAPASLRGCLLINGMVEFGGEDEDIRAATHRFQERFVEAMTAALRRAATQGQIPRSSIPSRTQLLLALALGVNVASRSGATEAAVGEMCAAAIREVRAWRAKPARARG